MTSDSQNVLFLCTGNSARSIIAECILNRLGQGRFLAYSAGSQPKGQVHLLALDLLKGDGHDLGALRSKNWDEFVEAGAPALDIVITVCDNAAGETCPVWPGHPVTAHWGLPDPAAAEGSLAERQAAFADCLAMLTARIEQLCDLPLDALEQGALQAQLDAIGMIEAVPKSA